LVRCHGRGGRAAQFSCFCVVGMDLSHEFGDVL
jgi:hypothetical protein